MKKYPDKFKLTPDMNRRFIVKNFTNLIYNNSRFEGLTTTMPQTQTIIDGMGVEGVSIDDINTIVQLKRGWQYMLNYKGIVDQDFEKKVNEIVARDDALIPGEFRTGKVQVSDYVPEDLNIKDERKFLSQILQDDTISTTQKAMTVMYHNMRNQLFWDGNKRTSSIVANKIMKDGGAGIIMVPLEKWSTWNKLIHEYYLSGKLDKILDWTYENGIYGINI